MLKKFLINFLAEKWKPTQNTEINGDTKKLEVDWNWLNWTDLIRFSLGWFLVCLKHMVYFYSDLNLLILG